VERSGSTTSKSAKFPTTSTNCPNFGSTIRIASSWGQLADALQADLEALQQEAAAQIRAATERCRRAGAHWAPPPEPLDAGLPAITPDGHVNQIIFAKRSLSQFQELEKPLGLAPVHSVSMYSPGTEEPGKYDWSAVDRQWDAVREAEIAKRTCLATPCLSHRPRTPCARPTNGFVQ